MKNDYLEALERALKFYNVEEKDDVLNKYSKRYDFGLESGMSEKEIEAMLGNPTEVAKKLNNDRDLIVVLDDGFDESKTGEEKKLEYKAGYNLVLKTVSEKLIVKYSTTKEIKLEFKDVDKDLYYITNDIKKGIVIDYSKVKYFSMNRSKGTITLEIPEDIIFDKIEITSNSSDIECGCELKGNKVEVGTLSGKVHASKLKGNEIFIHASSGKIHVENVFSKKCKIDNVSGSVVVDTVESQNCCIDTVSGNVTVSNVIGSYKAQALTGVVTVNGKEIMKVKDKIKRVFTRES